MNSQSQLQFASMTQSGLNRLDQSWGGRSKALGLFRNQYLRARWVRLWAAIRGQTIDLRNLQQDTHGKRMASRLYLGVRTVPIRAIVGSESRCLDFDKSFRPLKASIQDRWLNIAVAYLAGISLPPVELLQVGDVFYVRDGHHRISVAKAFNQENIDAEVVLWSFAKEG
jgi:hypothetical protein